MDKIQLEEMRNLADRINELIAKDRQGIHRINELFDGFYSELCKELKNFVWKEYEDNKLKGELALSK